jgi:hypothetical protein
MKGKPLVLEFFDYTVKPQTNGMKHVLYRIDEISSGKLIGYDFGFDIYNGEFGVIENLPSDKRAWVVKWAEIPNPKLLF